MKPECQFAVADETIPRHEFAQPIRHVGRYAMFGKIASGGMATLHLGRLIAAGGFARTVVIKRIRTELATDPEFVTMFMDEARAAARVHHSHVVPTLDVVQEGDELFIVMDYIAGESLLGLLSAACLRQCWIPLPVLSAIIGESLLGLHAAHQAVSEHGEPLDLVHRDFSPHNVIVGSDGLARIVDFGVAKASHNFHKTRSGRSKGKFAYMSPEQVRGDDLDRRSDLFAAGVTLWEALTQRRLFYSHNVSKTATDILFRAVDLPSTHNRSCTRALDTVVMTAVSKSPALRYRSALAMADALRAAVPPASHEEVASWVRNLASASLNERAAMVASIERATATAPRSYIRTILLDDEDAPVTQRDGSRLMGEAS